MRHTGQREANNITPTVGTTPDNNDRRRVNQSAGQASRHVMMATMLPEPVATDLSSIYGAEYAGLVRLATMLVDDRFTAEEVVQDAFVGLARRPGGTGSIAEPAAYLRRSVINGARSRLRRRGTRRRHLASVGSVEVAPGADVDVVRSSEHKRVMAALRQLSDRQREVLTLRYHLDLSEAQIADALGISAGSVKTHASRGLDHLRTLLEEHDR